MGIPEQMRGLEGCLGDRFTFHPVLLVVFGFFL